MDRRLHHLRHDASNHAFTAKTYATEAARDADLAWAKASNLHKVVFITDTTAFQVLIGYGPAVWQTIAGGNLGDVVLGDLAVGGTLDVVGLSTLDDLTANSVVVEDIAVAALNSAPSSATDTGTLGEIRFTAGHIYVCIATDTWVRIAIVTW